MQEDEFANIWVGWDINWCRPWYEVRASILVPSLVFILGIYVTAGNYVVGYQKTKSDKKLGGMKFRGPTLKYRSTDLGGGLTRTNFLILLEI